MFSGAAFGERWGVSRLYRDYREMLAKEQLDIVSVCTPTRSRAEVVEAVVESGVKAVFLEKPLARTLREADQIIRQLDDRASKPPSTTCVPSTRPSGVSAG